MTLLRAASCSRSERLSARLCTPLMTGLKAPPVRLLAVQLGMFTLVNQALKILRSVIHRVLIDVVDDLSRSQRLTRVCLQPHHASARDIRALHPQARLHLFVDPDERPRSALSCDGPLPLKVGVVRAVKTPRLTMMRANLGCHISPLTRIHFSQLASDHLGASSIRDAAWEFIAACSITKSFRTCHGAARRARVLSHGISRRHHSTMTWSTP